MLSFPKACFSRRILSCLPLALLPVLVALTGCSGGNEPANIVNGKILLKGEPVAGTIVFHKDGKKVNGPILPDGSYSVSNPPIGLCKVSVESIDVPMPKVEKVETPEMKGSAKMPGGGMKMAVPAPPKYRDPETSGLTITVKTGKQSHNFDLD